MTAANGAAFTEHRKWVGPSIDNIVRNWLTRACGVSAAVFGILAESLGYVQSTQRSVGAFFVRWSQQPGHRVVCVVSAGHLDHWQSF